MKCEVHPFLCDAVQLVSLLDSYIVCKVYIYNASDCLQSFAKVTGKVEFCHFFACGTGVLVAYGSLCWGELFCFCEIWGAKKHSQRTSCSVYFPIEKQVMLLRYGCVHWKLSLMMLGVPIFIPNDMGDQGTSYILKQILRYSGFLMFII